MSVSEIWYKVSEGGGECEKKIHPYYLILTLKLNFVRDWKTSDWTNLFRKFYAYIIECKVGSAFFDNQIRFSSRGRELNNLTVWPVEFHVLRL